MINVLSRTIVKKSFVQRQNQIARRQNTQNKNNELHCFIHLTTKKNFLQCAKPIQNSKKKFMKKKILFFYLWNDENPFLRRAESKPLLGIAKLFVRVAFGLCTTTCMFNTEEQSTAQHSNSVAMSAHTFGRRCCLNRNTMRTQSSSNNTHLKIRCRHNELNEKKNHIGLSNGSNSLVHQKHMKCSDFFVCALTQLNWFLSVHTWYCSSGNRFGIASKFLSFLP